MGKCAGRLSWCGEDFGGKALVGAEEHGVDVLGEIPAPAMLIPSRSPWGKHSQSGRRLVR